MKVRFWRAAPKNRGSGYYLKRCLRNFCIQSAPHLAGERHRPLPGGQARMGWEIVARADFRAARALDTQFAWSLIERGVARLERGVDAGEREEPVKRHHLVFFRVHSLPGVSRSLTV